MPLMSFSFSRKEPRLSYTLNFQDDSAPHQYLGKCERLNADPQNLESRWFSGRYCGVSTIRPRTTTTPSRSSIAANGCDPSHQTPAACSPRLVGRAKWVNWMKRRGIACPGTAYRLVRRRWA